MNKLVTICVPTYRRPSWLLHCLYSCLWQDYRPLEIDISDNSPTDDSELLVKSLTLPEGVAIRYWRNQPSIGSVESQKKLFAAARGRRLVWMNDDDVLLPEAVSSMAAGFARAPDVVAAHGFRQVINADGEVLPEATARCNAESERSPQDAGVHRDLLVSALLKQISPIGAMFLTDVVKTLGLRDRTQVGLAVDTDFAIRLAQSYRGSAYVLLDRMTIQSRRASSTLSYTASDVIWRLYDMVASMKGLSAAEELARERFLRWDGPLAVREFALAHRRRQALRVLLSRTYPHDRGVARTAYAAALIAMPELAFGVRRWMRNGADLGNQTSASRQQTHSGMGGRIFVSFRRLARTFRAAQGLSETVPGIGDAIAAPVDVGAGVPGSRVSRPS
ncbi:MAG TPA: glycosyltransferase [Acetobacteraceae bacterium]|nr:glycosyltransferase [Acetobacteraceae bacterium]